MCVHGRKRGAKNSYCPSLFLVIPSYYARIDLLVIDEWGLTPLRLCTRAAEHTASTPNMKVRLKASVPYPAHVVRNRRQAEFITQLVAK